MVDSSYKIIDNEYNISKEEKLDNWNIAIGLQKVDNLEVSKYLKHLSQKNIKSEISSYEVYENVKSYYHLNSSKDIEHSTKEADLVSSKINLLINRTGFSFKPSTLKYIHKFLFEDIYLHAGIIRTNNLSKEEAILGGKSVIYEDYSNIKDTLDYDFNTFREIKIEKGNLVNIISKFTSDIWQVHPFYEGNTRTTAVFIIQYLKMLNLNVNNDIFKDNSLYFRNALVRSNYADFNSGIYNDFSFLEKFFDTVINKTKNNFNCDETYLEEYRPSLKIKKSPIDRAKSASQNISTQKSNSVDKEK